MKREKLEVVSKKNKNKNAFNIKTYLKDFLLFANKHLIKITGFLFVLAVLFVAISFKSIINTILEQPLPEAWGNSIGLLPSYWNKIQVILVTALAGLVPYLYAPIVGFVGSVINEVSNLAYAIKCYGYFAGVAAYTIPLLFNTVVSCIATALGIYICKSITLGYKITNVKNMNWLNFRIELYKNLQKQDKVEELTKQKDKKIKKLESKKEKINYLQILNTVIVVCIIQFISVLIQHIVL